MRALATRPIRRTATRGHTLARFCGVLLLSGGGSAACTTTALPPDSGPGDAATPDDAATLDASRARDSDGADGAAMADAASDAAMLPDEHLEDARNTDARPADSGTPIPWRAPDVVARALRDEPGWSRPGSEVVARLLERTPEHAFSSACWFVAGEHGSTCRYYVTSPSAEVRPIEAAADALEELLAAFDGPWIALDHTIPQVSPGGEPVWPRADPHRPPTHDTMQIRIDLPRLRFETLMWLRHGHVATGINGVQLGGNVERASGDHENAPWSWRLAPPSVGHMTEIEVCDAWPAYVEEHLDGWIAAPTYLCHWALQTVGVIVAYRGERTLIIPEDLRTLGEEVSTLYEAVHGRRPPPLGGAVRRAASSLTLP